jgi:hypothetical protein
MVARSGVHVRACDVYKPDLFSVGFAELLKVEMKQIKQIEYSVQMRGGCRCNKSCAVGELNPDLILGRDES